MRGGGGEQEWNCFTLPISSEAGGHLRLTGVGGGGRTEMDPFCLYLHHRACKERLAVISDWGRGGGGVDLFHRHRAGWEGLAVSVS
jgi:hypothetical protein